MRRLNLLLLALFVAVLSPSQPALAASAVQDTRWIIDDNADAMALIGATLYLGGSFTSIDGQDRHALAAVDTTTGAVLPWAPQLEDEFARVSSLSGAQDRLYISGSFSAIDGQPRSGVAAFDTTTGALLPWNPDANGRILPVLASDTVLYVFGDFTTIEGQARNGIAAFDLSTGNLLPWNPAVDGNVVSIAISGATIYLGGTFTTVGGQPRQNIAAVTAANALPTTWHPAVNGPVALISPMDQTVYIAGAFTAIGGQPRGGLGAIEASAGTATPWAPMVEDLANPSPYLVSLIAHEGLVYVGGRFSRIGGAERRDIAVLDGATGAATAWAPRIPRPGSLGYTGTMLLVDNLLYVVPTFTQNHLRGYLSLPITAIDTRLGTTPRAATQIGATGATLNANVSIASAEADISFEITTVEGDYRNALRVAASPATLQGTATTAVSARVRGLKLATAYYYRVVVAGRDAVLMGDEPSFITLSRVRVLLPLVAAPQQR